MPISFYWMKLYYEILDDPKMGWLSDHLWRRTTELFLMAGEAGNGGYIPDIKNIAWRLRTTDEDIEICLKELSKCKIVEKTKEGWLIINYAERQGKSDNAERQARYRERVHKLQNSNEDSNDVVTACYTDKDKDKDKNEDEDTDAFSKIQRQIESLIGYPPGGKSAIDAIEKIIKLGAIEEDIKAGVEWIHSQGKTVKYYSSLVGPIQTAMAIRTQKPKAAGGVNPYEGAKHYE